MFYYARIITIIQNKKSSKKEIKNSLEQETAGFYHILIRVTRFELGSQWKLTVCVLASCPNDLESVGWYDGCNDRYPAQPHCNSNNHNFCKANFHQHPVQFQRFLQSFVIVPFFLYLKQINEVYTLTHFSSLNTHQKQGREKKSFSLKGKMKVTLESE